ncbi:MAG: Crp/Fnr family transcriptional regulator [Campylobacterales bacterium]|nr:Crp/Fnr family transcriptional regulator [Campylobacterales bacterium]MBN2832812.1 Crp/Fnr family transcriptional regulator [Campylobacterales bacterium]
MLSSSLENALATLHDTLSDLSPISPPVWEEAKGYFSLKTFPKGAHLFDIGDKVKDFYFLIDGLARYYYISESGKEFNKSFAEKPGHLLSSISSVSMQDEVSPFCVETLSFFTVLSISYEDFRALGVKHKEWNDLMLHIYERLIVKKERREADFLLLSAKERYLKFLKDYSMIEQVVANYHIASYLGITEVALSRIRKEMKLT